MKQLLLTINPEMYLKYKGLRNYLDGISMAICQFNFNPSDCSAFLSELSAKAHADTFNVRVVPVNETTWEIIHSGKHITFGSITKINLL